MMDRAAVGIGLVGAAALAAGVAIGACTKRPAAAPPRAEAAPDARAAAPRASTARAALAAWLLVESMRANGAAALDRLPQAGADDTAWIGRRAKVLTVEGAPRAVAFDGGVFHGELALEGGRTMFFVTPIAWREPAASRAFRGVPVVLEGGDEPTVVLVGAFL
jgi:hypothetical protein